MIVKLLTEHHLELISLKEGCRGSFESTHVKRKSHATANLIFWEMQYIFTLSIFTVPLEFGADDSDETSNLIFFRKLGKSVAKFVVCYSRGRRFMG